MDGRLSSAPLIVPVNWAPYDEGQSDEARVEPENNGGDEDRRPVVDRALLVTRGDATPRLEPIDAALDHIPMGIDCR